ncbi:MAG: PAS domain S-box protein [Desulfobacterales bacterium]|nr:MAG: PAS domain S-box protein [Desulfobacterales bacterium]
MTGKPLINPQRELVYEENLDRLMFTDELPLHAAERRYAKKLLQRRNEILKALYLATERFLRMPPSESSIAPILEKLGHATEVSRAYIFENETRKDGVLLTSQRYEWVASGITPQLDSPALQKVPFSEAGFGRWEEILSRGQMICGHVQDFSESEQALLAAQGILSILVAPICVGKKWWGFIGFDECRTEREWSPIEIEALKAAANIIGAAIQRKQAEEAVLASEKKYRLITENAIEGIFIAQDGRLQFVNPKTTEIMGYAAAELTDKPFVDFIHPDDRGLVLQRHQQRINGENPPSFYTFRVINKSGKVIWLELNVAMTTWKDRPATLNFIKDITARKQAEAELRKSEVQRQAILDASIDWIRHVDREMRLLWYNQTTAEGLQMSPGSAIGRTCYDIFFNKDTPCEGCPTLKAQQSGKIERTVMKYPPFKALKEESYWDAYSVPLKNETGDIVSFIQIARNITQQKLALQALQESEARYSAMFNTMSNGVAVYETKDNGEDFILLDFNQAAERINNIARQDVIGRSVLKVFPGIREFGLFEVFQRVWANGQPAHHPISIYRDARLEGWRENFVYRLPSGEIVAIFSDETERKQAEEKIHVLSQQLLKAQEIERQRIAGYLHDQVAQDLSALKIGCETLFDQQGQVPAELAQKMAQLSKLLQESISAVRDLSYDLRPPGMDQIGLTRSVFQYCEDFSQKNGINVDFYSAGIHDSALDFDTQINLFRLIQEGLTNIKKHARARQAAVRLVASSPHIILRIEDNGQGFNVENIWERVLKEKRMGLSSMEERVRLLGGKLSIQSRPSEGTKILIEVPFQENADERKEKHFDRG